MFKTLLKNKKAQNTAEYALLIALVVAGVIAMQTYAQRALQAKIRDTVKWSADKVATSDPELQDFQGTLQYEPYYQNSAYEVERSSDESLTSKLGGETTADSTMNRTRTGYQKASYNKDAAGAADM